MRNMLRVAMLCSVVAAAAAGCASGPARQDQGQGQGSGALVTREDLARNPGEPLERVLERKVPGLAVTRTSDGGYALRIRGATSYNGAGTGGIPLYVLNGMPIPAGPEGAVPNLDPFHIESIRVLRGSEAAVYGIEGGNGVIIITTRKTP